MKPRDQFAERPKWMPPDVWDQNTYPSSKEDLGEFYADYDEETGDYCVFHTENSKAYASYSSMEEAQAQADEMNRNNAYMYGESRVVRLGQRQLRAIISEAMNDAEASNEAPETIDLTSGWTKIVSETMSDVFDDPMLKHRVGNIIEGKSIALGDDVYYPSRIEDVEGVALDVANAVLDDQEFKSQLAMFIEQVVMRALRKGI